MDKKGLIHHVNGGAYTSSTGAPIKGKKGGEQDLRLLVLGLDNAGKTTVLKKIMGEEINFVTPTQGFNIKSFKQPGFNINVWDIGGQKAIRKHWKNYFDQIDILMYVIDATDKKRLEECLEELQNLLEEDQLSGIPLLFFANKQDLMTALEPEEIVEELMLDEIDDRDWSIFG